MCTVPIHFYVCAFICISLASLASSWRLITGEQSNNHKSKVSFRDRSLGLNLDLPMTAPGWKRAVKYPQMCPACSDSLNLAVACTKSRLIFLCDHNINMAYFCWVRWTNKILTRICPGVLKHFYHHSKELVSENEKTDFQNYFWKLVVHLHMLGLAGCNLEILIVNLNSLM